MKGSRTNQQLRQVLIGVLWFVGLALATSSVFVGWPGLICGLLSMILASVLEVREAMK
jgi:fatty acid desaturase